MLWPMLARGAGKAVREPGEASLLFQWHLLLWQRQRFRRCYVQKIPDRTLEHQAVNRFVFILSSYYRSGRLYRSSWLRLFRQPFGFGTFVRINRCPGDDGNGPIGFVCTDKVSSWPYGITYFWLLGQVLCEAQRREHSRSYVTGVVTKHDCMDAGARATQERLPGVPEQGVRNM